MEEDDLGTVFDETRFDFGYLSVAKDLLAYRYVRTRCGKRRGGARWGAPRRDDMSRWPATGGHRWPAGGRRGGSSR